MSVIADLSTGWTIALSLGAALLGGAIAFASTWFFRRREEKLEVTAGARLVEEELKRTEEALEAVRAKSRENPTNFALYAALSAADRAMNDSAWQETRLLLARYVGLDDWDKLRQAYFRQRMWWDRPEEPKATHDEAGDVEYRSERMDLLLQAHVVDLLLPSLKEARAICQKYVGLPPVEAPARPTAPTAAGE